MRAVASVLALVCLLAPGCASSGALASSDAASIDRLLTLIAERLEVAPDVARVKWNTHAAIEDLPREQQIITSVGRSAAEYGLPRLDAERFFQAQIDASKTIQLALTREFTDARRPPFPTVPSLDTDIRPRLDRLTPELLHALSAAMPLLTRPEGRQTLARRSRRGAPKGPGGVQAMEVAVGPLLARR